MIQIRSAMFETNSSSTCTLFIQVAQIEGLEIPTTVHINSDSDWWTQDINGCYAHSKRFDNDVEEFLGLLAYNGVKNIYVDDKLVEVDPENHCTKTRPEILLAKCFGEYKQYSESEGHGGEIGESSRLHLYEIKEIQDYYKNPDFIVICWDGEPFDTEIEWTDLEYSRRKIDEAEAENSKKYKDYNGHYDEDYDDEEDEDPNDYGDEYYTSKKKYHGKKKK